MQLTLNVSAPLYAQLLAADVRRHFERELALLCRGAVTIEAMRAGNAEWQRNEHRTVTVDRLPEEALIGQTCSIGGG